MIRKPTFTFRSFLYTAIDLILHSGDLLNAVRNHRVDRQFAGKILLAVNQVIDCRNNNAIYRQAALRAGVSASDAQQIMAGEFAQFPLEQAVALMFSQHYAEQDGHPYPAAWQSIVDYYGINTARDILACIRLFYFATRLGNTFDAIFHRRGSK